MACSLLLPNMRSARAPEMLLRFYQQERHHIPKQVIIIFITWEPHISLGISFRLSHSSQINKELNLSKQLQVLLKSCILYYYYQIRARFSASVQTGPEVHPASCTIGTGSFPGVRCGRGVTLTPHPLLVQRSKTE